MKNVMRRLTPFLLGASIFAGGCASLPRDVARGVVNRWTAPSAAAGHRLLDEYGLPDDVTLTRLTWNRRGVWKKTVVWNRAQVYRSPADLAVMQQTVAYPLDRRQAAELLAFSGSLEIDLARGELSSRADEEEINYLTLNLADEIARGLKTAPEAKETYARVVALTAAGKTSPYTQGLLFTPGG